MPLPIQMFGTVESIGEQLDAMFCRDVDQPDMAMIQWGGSQAQGAAGVLMQITPIGKDHFRLSPRTFYKTDAGGGLYAPQKLENYDQFIQLTAEVRLQKNVLTGSWGAAGRTGGRIKFSLNSKLPKVKARKLKNWAEFKTWANRMREEGDFVDFRGHGCSSFILSSAFHRAGRARTERFCYETIVQFQGHAESVLDHRFDRASPADFSVALGLAQHHGLPTPLLDWSASPYVAAFFAFSDAIENATARPKCTHVRVYALSKAVSLTATERATLTCPTRYATYMNIATWKNPRLLAQQGRFLLTNVADLEGFLCDVQKKAGINLLTAVDVPVSCAADALEDLQLSLIHI